MIPSNGLRPESRAVLERVRQHCTALGASGVTVALSAAGAGCLGEQLSLTAHQPCNDMVLIQAS